MTLLPFLRGCVCILCLHTGLRERGLVADGFVAADADARAGPTRGPQRGARRTTARTRRLRVRLARLQGVVM